MAKFFGFEVIRKEEHEELKEASVNLGLARRVLEDAGYILGEGFDRSLSEPDERSRTNLVQRSVHAWRADPLLGRNVDMHTDYTIGSGFGIPQTDNPDLKDVFDKFWSDKENQLVLTSVEAQRMKHAELQTSGNIFFTAFVNEGDGHVKLSDIPTLEVTDIISDPENRKKHLYYKRERITTYYDFDQHMRHEESHDPVYYETGRFDTTKVKGKDGEQFGPREICPGEVFHVSTLRLSDHKFGSPNTKRIIEWVKAHNEFMKARVSMMQALARFAWHKKVKGNPNQVQKLAASWRAGEFQRAAGANGETATDTGTNPVPPPVQYGSHYTTTDNISLEQVKTDSGATNAREDGRMLKGQIGVGAGFPLHYQGDIGGANLATATAMELPVLKMIEGEQARWVAFMEEIHDFVIIQAIEAGELEYADSGRFSKEAIENDLGVIEGDYQLDRDDEEIKEGNNVDRGQYSYKVVAPSIVKRQSSEIVNAVVNALKAVDPYAINVDASRWALRVILDQIGEVDIDGIVKNIFPEGFEYPSQAALAAAGANAQRGRSDRLEGDGVGQKDFKPGRPGRLPSESETGTKNMKRARQGDEVPDQPDT